jgi:hypothetical protein
MYGQCMAAHGNSVANLSPPQAPRPIPENSRPIPAAPRLDPADAMPAPRA